MRFSLPVKIAAALLSIVACAVCAASLMATCYLSDQGLLGQEQWNYYDTPACEQEVHNLGQTALWDYLVAFQQNDGMTMQYYADVFSPENTNFRFELFTSTGRRCSISTYEGESYGYKASYNVEKIGNYANMKINLYVVDPFTANDGFSQQAAQMSQLKRVGAPTVLAASAAVLLITTIYLICAAGRKKGEASVVVGGLHRVPFDILSLMVLIAVVIIMELRYEFDFSGWIAYIGWPLIFTTLYGIGLFYVMSFTVRCKAHNLWSGTLICRTWRWIKTKWLLLYRNLSSIWKSIVVVSAASFITLVVGTFCILPGDGSMVILFWFYMALLFMVMIGLAVGFQLRYHRIGDGIRRIVSGEPYAQINVQGLYGEMRSQAENLNRIQLSVQSAVEKQLKSERLKTELITNVSHDIKTPLTSIVNYVDLLKKLDVQDVTEQEYIEVLDRQSKRMKKLIEDLLEASKASTGNIDVHMAPLDTVEFLKQVTGEYVSRLREKDLELVLNLPDHDVPVLADGQLLWRVVDNLLGNAHKYSHPGTRIYLDLHEIQNQVVITFRNISAYPLNISGDELMERFVRGDSSRHTEGSGLGLSIARSLMDLMHGRFAIAIDGDLFKAQVVLGRLNLKPQPPVSPQNVSNVEAKPVE